MQTLHEQAINLVKDGQIIADNLNPNSNDKKMSIKYIQHLIAATARGFAELYGNVGDEK